MGYVWKLVSGGEIMKSKFRNGREISSRVSVAENGMHLDGLFV